MSLATLSDLKNVTDHPVYRRSIAPVAGGSQPRPLLPGTKQFKHPWLRSWHRNKQRWQPCDVACYSALDTVISGAGNVWIGGRLVTSPEIMPDYVANGLGL